MKFSIRTSKVTFSSDTWAQKMIVRRKTGRVQVFNEDFGYLSRHEALDDQWTQDGHVEPFARDAGEVARESENEEFFHASQRTHGRAANSRIHSWQ